MWASSSNFLATNQILCSCFFVSEQAVNDIKSLPHHCCHRKLGLIFIFLLQQQHFLISTKIMCRKVLILFNWSFLLQMWNKIFNIVICCLPPLYQAMKSIFPLCKSGITMRPMTHWRVNGEKNGTC